MNNKPSAVIFEPELFWLLLGNVRYAMGRMSTAPMVAQDAVRKYAHALKPHQVEQIGKEVREELRRCDERRAKDSYLVDLADAVGEPVEPKLQVGMGWWLGMEMDHRSWESFADWCERYVQEVKCQPST